MYSIYCLCGQRNTWIYRTQTDNLMLATLKARQVAAQLKTLAQVRDQNGGIHFQVDGR